MYRLQALELPVQAQQKKQDCEQSQALRIRKILQALPQESGSPRNQIITLKFFLKFGVWHLGLAPALREFGGVV